MYNVLAVILMVFIKYGYSQNPNCDFYQQVSVGRTYNINNPGYPYNYSGGLQCRWIFDCPDGYNCQLDCNLNMPYTKSCTMDRFMISKSGDSQLSGAELYCDQGTLTAVSTDQRISIALITSSSSPGGTFTCTITAQVASSTGTCSCGERRQNRIVGGTETGVNEYRFMVGLADLSTFEIYCGGVIINPLYVLTAAHCLLNQSPSTIAVVVGEHNVQINDSIATTAYGVSTFTPHPSFNSVTYDNDIAILKTTSSIVFSSLVGAVCLPFKYASADMTGVQLIVLGWGTEFFGGPKSDVLMQVTLDVISQSSCLTREPSLTANQFCTYTPGKDACQFDSGGPLLYSDSTTALFFHMGIVSRGRAGCATTNPGVNTRVTRYLNWIQNNTPGASYCVK